MTEKKINELKGNEILGRAILSSDYQTILPAGSVLKPEYIEKLQYLGIYSVFVKDEKPTTQEVAILKSDIEQKVVEKIKEVLEHHTYQHNSELAELCREADDVITSIISEEEIMEKVYDIRERSANVYEHSLSICSLAVVTAFKLGISKKTIHDIGVGCLLHDLGLRYLTIDYKDQDIMTLSQGDVQEFKKHPVYGYTAVKEEEWISDLSKNIILYHHERLDGSGYPLKATMIPIEIGIVNVCDAFDEMICGIGCEKVKVSEAVEYLKTFKNQKFDGKIVDEFLKFTAVYPAGTSVMTNEGEIAIVLSQNKGFPDRPVLRIVQDKDGNTVTGDVIKDLVKIHHVFIEKVLD